jgi:branched-chain amino acid transport system ATP-binding protein
MLSIENIEVVYDHVFLAIKGISLQVAEGGAVALLGSNGAGKSTTLKAVSGLLAPERGEVTRGELRFRGEDLVALSAPERVRLGIAQVLEGRRVFGHMTPLENLIAATSMHRSRAKIADLTERVFVYFPRLKERASVQAGYLSGGEQQMLAIGRALMSDPRVVLLDEPSLGLAPMLVEDIFGIVQRLVRQEKLSVLLVEQNATMALAVAEHGYVMETGRIVLEGSVAALRANSDIREFYLGLNEVGARKSYRDVKHYKRRKRWLS